MTKRMLIDAAHPEETRVVIVDGTRVEELDFESRNKRQLRGNVYLAKVTRVEPSLQAAFIEYGGNRHGFLAFSEIHPDYYQLPKADRDALQAEQEAELAATEAEDLDEDEEDENLDPDSEDVSDEDDAEVAEEQRTVSKARRRSRSKRRYKIQEVIKRGQILLVQAVKEERGNKGAAMTTYLSLAGRYCVLMPNTPRGGGISRKIASSGDRNRLKKIMADLDVPSGVGVIVRTAGAKRTKAEITRDYAYLSKLWGTIRDTTMESIAPALIHEEGNLVKRSIRDLYNKDIAEVLVQGDEAYRTAKDFIKMLMPSHAKFVRQYDDPIPLFLRYNVEKQIENSLDAEVRLKSGGYLVIHPTEALVSVDVNSGKSTKERNVERTALKTNLEAAEEVARQMRLRDLAGLIVIDFIDMDENRNNRAVEKKMKEVLARDRARIQTSRISQFGLMEISRQRRRRSLLEGSTTTCPHCDGVGRKRTVESSALAAIRAVEDFAVRGRAKKIRIKCPPDVAAYLLNEKRDLLTKVDEDADVFTIVEHDDSLIRPNYVLEVAEKRSDGRKDPLLKIEKDIEAERKEAEKERQREAAKAKSKARTRDDEDEDEDDESDAEETESRSKDTDDETESKPRRRRGRRGGRNRKRKPADSEASDSNDEAAEEETEADESSDDETPKPRSRRRAPAKDGGSRRRKAPSKSKDDTDADADVQEDEVEETPDDAPKSTRRRRAPSRDAADTEDAKPSRRRRAPSKAKADAETDEDDAPKRKRRAPSKAKAKAADEDDAPKPARRRKAPTKDAADETEEVKPARRRKAPAKSKAVVDDAAEDAPKPTRRRKAQAKAAKAEVEAADAEEAPKPARRRRAPSKAKAAAETEASVEEAPKPKTRRKAPVKAKSDEAASGEAPKRTRKAPAKAAAKSDEAEAKPKRSRKAPAKTAASKAKPAETGTDAEEAPAKPTRRRTAPKAKTEAEAKPVTDVSEAPAKPSRRRAAPTRKPAPEAVKAETPPAPEPAPMAEPAPDPKPSRRRAAPPRRKRGLLDRLMGKNGED